jgi:hypothetical protein
VAEVYIPLHPRHTPFFVAALGTLELTDSWDPKQEGRSEEAISVASP